MNGTEAIEYGSGNRVLIYALIYPPGWSRPLSPMPTADLLEGHDLLPEPTRHVFDAHGRVGEAAQLVAHAYGRAD